MEDVERVSVFLPLSEIALEDSAPLAEAMARALSGELLPPRRPAPPIPSGHGRLIEATDGILRAVVELHGPRLDLGIWWQCRGCDLNGYDAEPPTWPCGTVTLIADQLGVDLGS